MQELELKPALRLLEKDGIAVCIVGELALNYYNVPRVVHVSLFPRHHLQSFSKLSFPGCRAVRSFPTARESSFPIGDE